MRNGLIGTHIYVKIIRLRIGLLANGGPFDREKGAKKVTKITLRFSFYVIRLVNIIGTYYHR